MEFLKNNIHMNVVRKNLVTTFYVTQEGIVNEAYPAIEKIIAHKERVVSDNVSVRNHQVVIDGSMSYEMMYYSEESDRVYGLEGEKNFQEIVKLPDVEEGEGSVRLEIISTSVKLIDSRRYLYKVGVMAYVTVEQIEDLECIRLPQGEDAQILEKEIEMLAIKADKNEMVQVHEIIRLPQGKPAIEKIVWKEVELQSVSTKVMDRQVEVSGELSVFLMYRTDVENSPEQWLETTIPFTQIIESEEAAEGMVSYATVKLHTVNLAVQMNQDNELKEIAIAALLQMNIKLFEEKETSVIEDIYSPKRKMIPEFEEGKYYKLLVKNQARTKETIKVEVENTGERILQLCHGSAELRIENVIVGDNSIKILGKILAKIIYVSTDDHNPICCRKKEIPFEHIVDAENARGQDKYYIDWRTEQITANMISGNEVEMKVVIAMEVFVFREEKGVFLKGVREEEFQPEELSKIPLIKGYVVDKGDTLWHLAKINHTTVEEIVRQNNLAGEKLKEGDKLLIVKSCQ